MYADQTNQNANRPGNSGPTGFVLVLEALGPRLLILLHPLSQSVACIGWFRYASTSLVLR